MLSREGNAKDRLRFSDVLLLLAIAAAAMAVQGYHPYVEDAEIYLPGIKKLLNPRLYPQNDGFFSSHAGMTLFPNLIAASVRLTHLPFSWALLAWQFLCTFVLLLACWKIGRHLFADPMARWGGVAMVASLLTIPVAGTALYIMDQYLNTRSISAAAVLMMAACAAERRYRQAAAWAVFTAAIHPLMFVFGFSFTAIYLLLPARAEPIEAAKPKALTRSAAAGASLLIPFAMLSPAALGEKLFPPVTPLYEVALRTRPCFFLSQWQWYEVLGLAAPFALLGFFEWIGRRRKQKELASLCRALNCYGALFAVASLLTIPASFARFTLLQPMRYLHLTYILMFLVAGGLLAESVLRRRWWRWLVLYVPLCAGMFYAQRQLFPDTPHLELPGIASSNPWVKAFVWVRENTPEDAYFALNPEHMRLPGEDQHGFRALAERSMMADAVKDSGAVVMFPGLAARWKTQTDAEAGWKNFRAQDFARLNKSFGVQWVVLQGSSTRGLNCPYQNSGIEVCRIE